MRRLVSGLIAQWQGVEKGPFAILHNAVLDVRSRTHGSYGKIRNLMWQPPKQMRVSILIALVLTAVTTTGMSAQFRRGVFSESTEITLYPLGVPALLLPAGSVQLEVRNASGASARIVQRLQDLLGRQLTDNDSRLSVVEKGAEVTVAVTLIDWKEARRNSTKYVSETRQIGTRQVKDKNGNLKTEPVYEYGRNRPSVVIEASAGLRVEVKRARGAALADETVRHTLHEEHLADASPPSTRRRRGCAHRSSRAEGRGAHLARTAAHARIARAQR